MTIDDLAIVMAQGFKEIREDITGLLYGEIFNLRTEMNNGFALVDKRLTTIEYKRDQHTVEIKSLSPGSHQVVDRVEALETEVFGTLHRKRGG